MWVRDISVGSIADAVRFAVFLVFLLTSAAPPALAEAMPPKLAFIGEATIPPGFQFGGTPVGGLSGIDYAPDDDLFYAISDDRSKFAPARFYTLHIDLADGTLGPGDISLRSVVIIRKADGDPFDAGSVDPEAIRYDAASDSLYWTSEGDAAALIPPSVRQMTPDGAFIRQLDLPRKFVPTARPSGVRANFAFESLTLLPGSLRTLTGSENALFQDGPAASPSTGSPARWLENATVGGGALREFVYVTDPVASPPDPPSASSLAGLVDLLAVDKTHYLALERSFSAGVGHSIKLYYCSIVGATNVRSFPSIVGRAVQPVSKQLVADLADFGLVPDNIEGVTFGPRLPDGKRSLIFVSDNNFSATRGTRLLAFRYTPPRSH